MDGWGETTPAPGAKLTYDDFLSFPDDGLRHELIDGEHYVTPSPTTKHQRVSRDLLIWLAGCLRASGRGEVLAAPFDVVLSWYDIVEPDLLVILNDQAQILTDKHVRGAPAIVIEILSPGTRGRDETAKRQLYETSGVREYWMVDPEREVVTLCRRLHGGGFAHAIVLSAAGAAVLTSPLLPGLSLALPDLFGRS